MLILDWNKNSEEILKQGHYNTKRSVNAEQAHLCRYWQEKGFDKEEAYKIWVSLESPQVVGCFEEEERREYFESFWTKAMEEGPNERYAYGLTCKEFDFINGLDVDLEYKNFLKTLVEYCRTYGKNGVFYCPQTIYNGLVKQGRRSIPEAREIKMATWNVQYVLYATKVYQDLIENTSKCQITLFFFDKNGINDCHKKLSERTHKCPMCNKEYVVTNKRKTDLCPECQHRESIKKMNYKYYESHPNVKNRRK